jgi:hypothetical protein
MERVQNGLDPQLKRGRRPKHYKSAVARVDGRVAPLSSDEKSDEPLMASEIPGQADQGLFSPPLDPSASLEGESLLSALFESYPFSYGSSAMNKLDLSDILPPKFDDPWVPPKE